MTLNDLFNDVEYLSTSGHVVRVVNVLVVPDPRLIRARRPSRGEREESEVAVGHVAILGAEQKSRRDFEHRVTVDHHCHAHRSLLLYVDSIKF